MSEKIIYQKKHKIEDTEYYYYVTKKGDRYYVYVEVVDHIPVTPTWTVVRGEEKECILERLNKEQAKEIIQLLRKGKYEELEENYDKWRDNWP
jgi:diadenosine tetraphosphate (Ap4A) HIT family hydrolase